MENMKSIKKVIDGNIDYPTLVEDYSGDAPQIDEYVRLIEQTCCSDKLTVRINGRIIRAMPCAPALRSSPASISSTCWTA